jgi:hypothetical protein
MTDKDSLRAAFDAIGKVEDRNVLLAGSARRTGGTT